VTVRITLIAVILAIAAGIVPAFARSADDRALDELLTRLNLGELRLHHMERLLEREAAGD
jgi:hypothetical protein